MSDEKETGGIILRCQQIIEEAHFDFLENNTDFCHFCKNDNLNSNLRG